MFGCDTGSLLIHIFIDFFFSKLPLRGFNCQLITYISYTKPFGKVRGRAYTSQTATHKAS